VRLLLVAILLVPLFAGCSLEARDPLTAPQIQEPGPGPDPPDPPEDPCGVVDGVSFQVSRSSPRTPLFTRSFSDDMEGELFVQIRYRTSRNHEHEDVQFVAVRQGSGSTVVIRRPGEECGVLADSEGTDGPLTRFAGEVSLDAGTWTFWAVHGSDVDCWDLDDDDNNPVEGLDLRLEWCYDD
jgi:hypothetical protein